MAKTDLQDVVHRWDVPVAEGLEVILDQPSSERPPFFYPTREDNTGLCYAALSVLRWRNRYNLIHGQIVRFSQPLTGYLNAELELALYVMVARIHKVDRERGLFRFEAALSGTPEGASTALHGESAAFYYRPDSLMGFLGNNTSMHNLSQEEVLPLLCGDGYTENDRFIRRSDGRIPIQPRFYQLVSKQDPDGEPKFDVETGKWLFVKELPQDISPVWLPAEHKAATFTENRQWLENRHGGKFVLGQSIYVGTDTMRPLLVGDDSAEQIKQMQEKLHNSLYGYAWQQTQGIRPGLFGIPRQAGLRESRQAHLKQVLNAYGRHVWQKQLFAARG